VDNFTNPTANDSLNLPSHSTQHANANDAIEAIEGYLISGTGADWITFTPTFSNFTLGNGTVSFAYSKIGKTVHVRYSLTLGSTSSMGTGPSFALPFNNGGMPSTNYVSNILDSGTAFFIGITRISSNTVEFALMRSDTLYPQLLGITSTVPFTWTTNDLISGTFTYQAV
jgi:hypothetical protein